MIIIQKHLELYGNCMELHRDEPALNYDGETVDFTAANPTTNSFKNKNNNRSNKRQWKNK